MADKHQAKHLEKYKWKKGQKSPNPNGRPPNPLSLLTIRKELLNSPAPEEILKGLRQFIPPQWKEPITWGQAMALRDCSKAISLKWGDKMAQFIGEQIDGKAPIQISGPGGGPIALTNQRVNLSKFTDEQLEQWQSLMEIASEDGDEG
jgi:hypothetical protein